eukprot:365180-Chlamydomonas_euryale.AAC.10
MFRIKRSYMQADRMSRMHLTSFLANSHSLASENKALAACHTVVFLMDHDLSCMWMAERRALGRPASLDYMVASYWSQMSGLHGTYYE